MVVTVRPNLLNVLVAFLNLRLQCSFEVVEKVVEKYCGWRDVGPQVRYCS